MNVSSTTRDAARTLLRGWLFARLGDAGREWLAGCIERLARDRSDSALDIALGLVPRRFGNAPLDLSATELESADACLPGWYPAEWSVADGARILLLAWGADTDPTFAPRFRRLCQTADVAEAIALYRGLPLYPQSVELEATVAEGLRGNMRSVFDAIAHHNPYPQACFDPHRWNHMVLKALFVGSRLAPIQGLERRNNAELARIMRDFAHERWAAGRVVPFEIWRCVGPHATGEALADLERALTSADPVEQRAAALALAASPDPAAPALLRRLPELASDLAGGRLTWASLD